MYENDKDSNLSSIAELSTINSYPLIKQIHAVHILK